VSLLTIEVCDVRPTDTGLEIRGAVDADVIVAGYRGQLTLVPCSSHPSILEPYGNAPDMWISATLLARLTDANVSELADVIGAEIHGWMHGPQE